MQVRAYVSMCFGDPWRATAAGSRWCAAARRLMDLGAEQLTLGDTIGARRRGHVRAAGRAESPACPTPCWFCTPTTPTGRPWVTPRPRCEHGGDHARHVGGLGRRPVRGVGHAATSPPRTWLWMLDRAGDHHGVSLPRVVGSTSGGWALPHLDHELDEPDAYLALR